MITITRIVSSVNVMSIIASSNTIVVPLPLLIARPASVVNMATTIYVRFPLVDDNDVTIPIAKLAAKILLAFAVRLT